MPELNLSETIQQLTKTIQEQQNEIRLLQIRIQNLESRAHQQNAALVAPRFLTRAFVVWGHYFVAQILLAIGFLGIGAIVSLFVKS